MSDWLAAADRVAAVAAAHAAEGEQLRRLPMPVVEAMRAEGVQRMCVPAAYGGPELDPPTILQVIERIAAADGAAGWCTMIALVDCSGSICQFSVSTQPMRDGSSSRKSFSWSLMSGQAG